MNILSISKNSFRGREYIFWGNLPLSRKLLLAFSILFVPTMVSALITLTGSRRIVEKMRSYAEVQAWTEYEALVSSIGQENIATVVIEGAS